MEEEKKETVNSVISRMVNAVGARNPSHMQNICGFSNSATSLWKKRRNVPDSAIIRVAELSGYSIVWLKLGIGKKITGRQIPMAIESDIDMLEWLLENSPDEYLNASGYIRGVFVKAKTEQ